MQIAQQLQSAVDHYNAGRIKEAEALYRQILAVEPGHADALHLLGVVEFRNGRPDEAIRLIGQALAINPAVPDFWNNVAAVLLTLGRYDHAAKSAKQAIELKPDYADAHYHLARGLLGLNKSDEAVVELNNAILLRPNHAEALNTLGNMHHHQGRHEQAIEAYQRALAVRPKWADAYANLSAALDATGKYDQAIAAGQAAVLLQPNHGTAWSNLSQAMLDAGLFDGALDAANKAIEHGANPSAAQNNRGRALLAKRQVDEAADAFRAALLADPRSTRAHNNIGSLLFSLGHIEEALRHYDAALAINPADAGAQSNRLYALHFHPQFDAAGILREHRDWQDRFAAPLAPPFPSYDNPRTTNRKLRIGYVSADFRHHVVAHNVLPLIQCHDRDAFEITCYSNTSRTDDLTEIFKQRSDRWRPIVGISDDRVAEQVRQDGIDILVDLSLHMAGNRLLMFARRPAPVQATFAGYPGGVGMDAIQYRLTDPYLDPPGADSAYAEQSIRLADSFWVYEPRRCADVQPPPALKTHRITFGCLNLLSKVNSASLSLWAKVMREVADSQLLLLAPPSRIRQELADQLASEGINPSRLVFVDRAPMDEYLANYHRIDICLDTFPYNGHSTSLDALWMGVPVVTLMGQTVVGRAGWSQLSNLNLTELAALTERDFVRIATSLAGDLPRLVELRRTMRKRMRQSPLTDTLKFTQQVEMAYRLMWNNYVRG